MICTDAKQLETGDKILIEAIFDRIDEDGDASIEYTNSVSDCECGFIDPKHIVGVASETQLNKPKYDPCRLFKKGDKVKPRAGRDVYACEWEDAVFHKLTGVYELESDEKEGHVSIFDNETGIECYAEVELARCIADMSCDTDTTELMQTAVELKMTGAHFEACLRPF